MRSFLVRWELEVDAKNAIQAASKARVVMSDEAYEPCLSVRI